MSQHINNTCKAAYIQIRQISSIRHLLTTQATQTLVCSLVLSRLDYCNSLFSGCPRYLLDKLQKVQNAAARLVCKAKKSDHIHPILETLHWLPVTHRIQYKISTICFSSIFGTAPQYLSNLLQPYTPARQLWFASDTRTFVTPCVNTKTFGERSFSYAGPSVWNNFPQTLRHSDSTSSFKAALKMHLFNISKLFFTALPIPLSDAVCVCVCVCVWCVCVCVCVVSVIVKHPVLPPCVVDGRSRNPLLLLLLLTHIYALFCAHRYHLELSWTDKNKQKLTSF